MPRRVQDIVPGDRRSIRNISLERKTSRTGEKDEGTQKTEKGKAEAPSSESAREKGREIPIRKIPITPPPVSKRERVARGGRGKWFLIVAGIIVVVAAAGYVASAYFSRATFTIVPKSIKVTPDSTYVAQAQAGAGASALVYELATVTGSASTTVPATDGQQVSTKAQGTLTVYNAYSATTQRLVAGTRFVSPGGKVYRTTSSIVIPGYKTSGGKVTPGTVSAAVVADKPGEEYNIFRSNSTGDFTIAAYKGTPRYESMYGRLASDITGGFLGTKKSVSPTVLEGATASLKSNLTAGLLAQIKNSVPDGYIMYDSLNVSTFSKPVIGGSDPNSAVVSMQGTITGIFLKKDQLAERLAGEQAKTFGNFDYNTPGLESLSVNIANARDFSPARKNTLLLNIKGEMMLVGAIPVEKLKSELAGASLARTQEILRPYKQIIDKGSGELIPPWSKVPTDPDRISIVVTDPTAK